MSITNSSAIRSQFFDDGYAWGATLAQPPTSAAIKTEFAARYGYSVPFANWKFQAFLFGITKGLKGSDHEKA